MSWCHADNWISGIFLFPRCRTALQRHAIYVGVDPWPHQDALHDYVKVDNSELPSSSTHKRVMCDNNV